MPGDREAHFLTLVPVPLAHLLEAHVRLFGELKLKLVAPDWILIESLRENLDLIAVSARPRPSEFRLRFLVAQLILTVLRRDLYLPTLFRFI